MKISLYSCLAVLLGLCPLKWKNPTRREGLQNILDSAEILHVWTLPGRQQWEGGKRTKHSIYIYKPKKSFLLGPVIPPSSSPPTFVIIILIIIILVYYLCLCILAQKYMLFPLTIIVYLFIVYFILCCGNGSFA